MQSFLAVKRFEDLFEPDGFLNRVRFLNHETGLVRENSAENHHETYSRLALVAAVPDEVSMCWVETLHLAIYGYYCRTFLALADQQSLVTLELAIKIRLGLERSGGLRSMLLRAENAGWIDKEALLPRNRLPAHQIIDGGGVPFEPQQFWEMLLEELPALRNEYAHGTGSRWPLGGTIVELVRTLIHQVYSSPTRPDGDS